MIPFGWVLGGTLFPVVYGLWSAPFHSRASVIDAQSLHHFHHCRDSSRDLTCWIWARCSTVMSSMICRRDMAPVLASCMSNQSLTFGP
jgi:hypothetical protein